MNNLAETSPEVAESSILKDRVRKLANRRLATSGGVRDLEGDCAETLLASLLREIDETILPRRLIVTTTDGSTIEVVVSNRRLIGLTDTEASHCDDPKRVLDRLRSAIGQAASATVRTERTEDTPSCSHTGVSARSLLALLALFSGVGQDVPEPNPIPEFFAELQSQMFAWVTLSRTGRIHKKAGEVVWQARLVKLAETQLADLEAQRLQSRTSQGQPACILLNFGDENGFILLYARSDTSGFLALLTTGNVTAIQTAWNARFA
jgi:hypothetical protein